MYIRMYQRHYERKASQPLLVGTWSICSNCKQLFAEEHSETLPHEKINVSIYDTLQCLNDKEVKEYISTTQSSYEKSQQGEFGYTRQYWMTYIGLVDLFKKFHYAIACNDFDLRLAVWEELFPFCFVFNNVHYACYGT